MKFICCLTNLIMFLEHLFCAKILGASEQDRGTVWWEKGGNFTIDKVKKHQVKVIRLCISHFNSLW